MNVEEMVAELEEIMDVDTGSLQPETVLEELEEWDSLSKLSLIAFAKKSFGIALSNDEIKGFNTVADICNTLCK